MPKPTIARRGGALATAAVIAASMAASAQAATGTAAACTSLITLQFTPGFTMAPGSGSVTSGGQTGTLICAGILYGHRITGPGTFGVVETYNTPAGCLSDSATGHVTATLPTTAGPVTIVGALTEYRLGLLADIHVAFPQAQFSGSALIAPTIGLCVLLPLTEALVTPTGTLFG